MLETTAVLKKEVWMGTGSRIHRIPVNGVVQVDIKVRDHRPSIDSHVCRRGHKGLLNVLHLFDERLLRRTASTGAQLYGAFIHHDGESEAGMLFGFSHHRQSSLVAESVSRSVPVDDHTIDAPADHVRDLTMDLRRILRAVAHIHVAGIAKPGHQMSVYLGARTGIQKRMDIQLADIASTHISVALRLERIRRASIVGGFGLKSGGRNYFEGSGC